MIAVRRGRHLAWLAPCAALAWSAAAAPAPAGRVAVVTIAPLSGLVEMVAGPAWTVRTLVPPGRSPHVFEPTPREVRSAAAARVIVTVGAGYDGWIARVAAACASTALIHDAGLSIGITAGADHEASEGVPGHDPHWWLSPELAARALEPLAERFASLDAENADAYRHRAALGAQQLRALDVRVAAELAPVRGRAFVSAHPAWVYFARRYGLRSVGSIEPVPGREPSPRELLSLLKAARRGGAPVIFTEPQFPKTAATVIGREGRLELVEVDPIGGTPGREGYAELLLFNAAAFRRGLSIPPARGGPAS